MTDIHIAANPSETAEVLKIREEVFVNEQHVPLAREQDGLDASCEHAILYYDSIPAGTARINCKNRRMKLERIAVLKAFRGKKLGIQLMKFLVNYGKEKKVEEISMHAQYYLVPFYSRFGFKKRGDIFYDANIKHIEMFIPLDTISTNYRELHHTADDT